MSVAEKIQALHAAKLLTNVGRDAVTRVLVNSEDVAAVIAAMARPKVVAPKPAGAVPAAAAAAAAPAAAAKPKEARAPRPRQEHTGEPSKTTLFVANLPFSTDNAALQQLFAAFKVKDARVAVRRDGRSRGYGFVTFETEADMQAGLKVDGTDVAGRPVSVRVVLGEVGAKPATPAGGAAAAPRRERAPRPVSDVPVGEASKTVAFVGNLPFTVDDAGLRKIFEGYALKDAHVSARPNGRSKGYALVSFETEADQTKAIAALNGKEIEGRAIHVLPSTKGSQRPAGAMGGASRAPREPRAPRAPRQPSGEPSKTSLFVANLPFVVDDNGLLQIFEGFQVKEAHVAMRMNGKSCGFGFVSFETEAEAQRAMQVVDKSIVEGREIAVRPAHSAATGKGAVPAAPAAK